MAAQQKRIGESKIIAARAEVEAAKLMRKAADILSSPAAMQIRSLEAYQQIAKTAGAKVMFLPPPNAGGGAYGGAGPSNYRMDSGSGGSGIEDIADDPSFQRAMNAEIVGNF